MVVFWLSVYVFVLLNHFVLFSVLVHDFVILFHYFLCYFLLAMLICSYAYQFWSSMFFIVTSMFIHIFLFSFYDLWYACFWLLFPSVYDLCCFMFSSYHSSGSLYFIVFRFDLIVWGVIKSKCFIYFCVCFDFIFYSVCLSKFIDLCLSGAGSTKSNRAIGIKPARSI